MAKNKKHDQASDDRMPPEDAEDLALTEISGSSTEDRLDLSETDEDEDEALGDGKIGRSTPDLLDK
jgi:hypothetical protein